MVKVIGYALEELNAFGSVKFSLDRVLERSGVSRSSVYHHFGNRDGLIAAAEVEQFTSLMMNGVEYVRERLLKLTSIDEWLQEIEEMLQLDGGVSARDRRIRRISSIVVAQQNPDLHASLTKVQMEGTRHLAESMQMLVELGLMHPTAPILGIAHLFQSILVGRVLVDLDEDPEASEQWTFAAFEALRHLINGGENSLEK